MHEARPDHDTTREPDKPRQLSHSDPPPDAGTHQRAPLLLVILIVLVVTAVVVLHLTGVVGPGSH